MVDKIITRQQLDITLLTQQGIPRNKIECVPPSFPDEILTKCWEKTEHPFERYVIYVGRLHVEKSPEHILHAIHRIKRRDFGVVFIGPDEGELSKLQMLVRDYNLKDRVKFFGRVDNATKYALLSGAEFLVLPSMYEGFGRVLLEAWAMGRAVIASRVGGVPYVVSDGGDGLLYNWGDIETLAKHIEFLLENEDVRKKMGIAGRKKVEEKYTTTKVMDRMEKIYEEVLASNS